MVVGRSNIVGKPAALLLLQRKRHRHRLPLPHQGPGGSLPPKPTSSWLRSARPKFITGDMVKPGAVVIDVGINRGADGKLCGDVDFAAAAEKAAFITPVPGGVGLMTRAMLMENTLRAAKLLHGIE